LEPLRVKDHILLLLAIKPFTKIVELDHIIEKVSRNSGASREVIISTLNELLKEGLVRKVKDGYVITDNGRRLAWDLVYDENLTLSYRLVLLARYYYPKMGDLLLPFLKDRPVSVIKVFSDEKDPIRRIKPIFSRYKKMKPRTYHLISTIEDLLRYVDMHAIDFIPYVHRIGNDYPDWLIIDIDAGEEIKKAGDLGFAYVKEITKETFLVMKEELRLTPCLKFSGSRGFQIWVSFHEPIGKFEEYRKCVTVIRDLVESHLETRYNELKEKYEEIFYTPITTSTVAKKEARKKQILLDWSSMKEEGDVRAPWSMHYKTGLISVPLRIDDIDKFQIDAARVENVVKNRANFENVFHLEPSDPTELKKLLMRTGLLRFF